MALAMQIPHDPGVAGTSNQDSSSTSAAISNAGCRDDELKARFERLDTIGTGVYGQVYRARNRETGEIVALKTMHYDDFAGYGVPSHVIREASILMNFVHPNVVRLYHVYFCHPQEYNLILEYVETDLNRVVKQLRLADKLMPLQQVANYSRDILNGIHACHVRMIVHRDLKPQNVLVSRNGLKICDFGLSRWFSKCQKAFTQDVITLWYRAPEILLGEKTYGPEVDMWSAGCCIAEMGTSYPIFPGESEIGTIFKIMKLLGTPTEETWPGVSSLQDWSSKFPQWPAAGLAPFLDRRPELGLDGGDFIRGLLVTNPKGRLTARRARSHSWFDRFPM